jgi:hypothetical protein
MSAWPRLLILQSIIALHAGATISFTPMLTITWKNLIAVAGAGLCCGANNGCSGGPASLGMKNYFPTYDSTESQLQLGTIV